LSSRTFSDEKIFALRQIFSRTTKAEV